MNVADLTITSLETITGFDVVTGDYVFTLDELQNASIANSQEVTEITGKGGRKISQLKRNKAVTISGSNGMVSGGQREAQTGGTFENKTTEVLWTDCTLGTELEQDSTAATGKFAYAPGTKALTFSGIDNGTEIVVIYKRKITADVLTNESDKYSKKMTLYVDALAEDKCANVYRVQFFIPKADFSGEFTLDMGDNQTTHDFEAESLTGACGALGGSLLWTYTIFGANTEDAA